MTDQQWEQYKPTLQYSKNFHAIEQIMDHAWGVLVDNFYSSDLSLSLPEKDKILKESIKELPASLWSHMIVDKNFGTPPIQQLCQMLCDRVGHALEKNINALITENYHATSSVNLVLSRNPQYFEGARPNPKMTKEQFLQGIMGLLDHDYCYKKQRNKRVYASWQEEIMKRMNEKDQKMYAPTNKLFTKQYNDHIKTKIAKNIYEKINEADIGDQVFEKIKIRLKKK